jgi:hypothetical protein
MQHQPARRGFRPFAIDKRRIDNSRECVGTSPPKEAGIAR